MITTYKGRAPCKRPLPEAKLRSESLTWVPRAKAILAYHFVADGQLAHLQPSMKALKGLTYVWYSGIGKQPLLCSRGLHASRNIWDAMEYIPDEENISLCRVELWGVVDKGKDKLCATHRKILWIEPLPDLGNIAIRDVLKKHKIRLRPCP